MSLIPEFELGLWNGWIFVLPFLLVWLWGLIVNKGKWEEAPLNEKEKPISRLSWVVMLFFLSIRFFYLLELTLFGSMSVSFSILWV